MSALDDDTIGYLIAEAALTTVEIASGIDRVRIGKGSDRNARVVAARSAACVAIRHVTGWSAERIGAHIGLSDNAVKYHLGTAGPDKAKARKNGPKASDALRMEAAP
jgi:hypothetical protein